MVRREFGIQEGSDVVVPVGAVAGDGERETRMGDRHEQQREAHVAVVTSVSSQATAPNDEIRREEQPVPPGHQRRGRPPRRRNASLLVAGAVCALAVMLLVLLADAGRTTASTTQVTPTPTPSPTATVTPFPSPTPMIGFKVYMDTADGFVIQYPSTWESKPLNPGAQFDDDPIDTAYQLQVLVPGFATSAGPTGSPDDASVWVNYALDTLSRENQSSFQVEPGPCTNTILGPGWQCGIGDITQNQTVIRVEVNATVHNGKPYIIAELASADRFSAGNQAYFWPMERSFQFLPANS